MPERQQLISLISIIGLVALVVASLLMYQATTGGNRLNWGNLFGNRMPAAMVGGDTPQTATSTNTDTTPGPKSFSSYDSYVNGPAGWLISFPHSFSLTTQAELGAWSMPTGTLISFYMAPYEGTNLSEAKVALVSFPAKGDVINCFPNLGEKPHPSKVVLKGTTWYRNDQADAGAGNFYETETYATVANNTCHVISLLIHSTNIGNYPDNARPKPFDKSAIEKIFSEMLNSFAWVN